MCGLKENSPFQIDGNLGAPNGLIEMLVQSQGETPLAPAELRPDEVTTLRLWPALPAAWPQGRVRGLRARGGIRVELVWAAGKPVEATLRADRAAKVKVVVPRGVSVKSRRAQEVMSLRAGETARVEFA